MNIRKKIKTIAVGFAVVATGLAIDGGNLGRTLGGIIINDAQARVGRPMTPASVGGVARRTTRRSIRRSTVYVATLPKNCTTVVIDGTKLSQCGTTYYQSHSGQYAVVYVD
jgi:hypothetical protein